MENKDLKLIFTGSNLQASYLESYLNDNDVPTMTRDSMEESVIAGWASGAQEDSTRVYVNASDFDVAIVLVDQFMESLKKTEE